MEMYRKGHLMNDVCGVVVTFRPKANVPRNLECLRPQVSQMVVVDNGSNAEQLSALREASLRLGFKLIENGSNLGIGVALNLGIEYGRSQGAKFAALFDQDSTPEPNLIEAMVRTYTESPWRDQTAIVAAKHLRELNGQCLKLDLGPDGGPYVAITSGSLIPMKIFDVCGMMEEEMIIDRHDEDFSLRVRSRGFKILQCEDGVLWVTLGDPEVYRLRGRDLFLVTNYSAARRYYLTRNRLVIVKRHWRKHTGFCYISLKSLVKEFVFVLLAEQKRPQKVVNMARGVLDAALGRMGKIVPL
jgi:rhamnosyltransferase